MPAGEDAELIVKRLYKIGIHIYYYISLDVPSALTGPLLITKRHINLTLKLQKQVSKIT